jgi:hypothetical protein
MAAQQQQPPPLSEADIPQLLKLLQAALSSDAGTQKQAEAMLASLESRTGFCSCLAVSVHPSSPCRDRASLVTPHSLHPPATGTA